MKLPQITGVFFGNLGHVSVAQQRGWGTRTTALAIDYGGEWLLPLLEAQALLPTQALLLPSALKCPVSLLPQSLNILGCKEILPHNESEPKACA